MSIIKVRIQLYGFTQLFNRFVVLPLVYIVGANFSVNNQGKRIKFLGALHFGVRLFKAAFGQQRTVAVPLMRGRIVWIQGNRLLKFFLAFGPVPVIVCEHCRQRRVGFGQVVIKLDRFLGRRLCFRRKFLGRTTGIIWKQAIGVREARIRQREVGIFFNRLIEIVDRFLKRLGVAFVPIKATFQIKPISLCVVGVVLHH